MKIIRNVLILAVLLCSMAIYHVVRPAFFTRAPSPVVAAANAESTAARPNTANAVTLEKHVRALSEDFTPRDHRHPENLNKVASYIAQQWQTSGLAVKEQPFQVHGITYKNVITQIGNASNGIPKIVIGAHYDAAGELPAADDNASGVAGLLELARLLKAQHDKTPLPYTIELVAYTLEEPPYFATQQMGSYIHAAQAKNNNEHITYMLSLEMLGYYRDEPNSQHFPTPLLKPFYPNTGNFIAVIGQLKPLRKSLEKRIKVGMTPHTQVPVYAMDAPAELEGIDFSDHRNYWAHGYPAAMLTDTAFFRNKNYHTPNDTADTLNYVKMAQVIDGLAVFLITEALSESR